VNPLHALTRFAKTDPGRAPVAGETCELCRQPLDAQHRHVLDLERQQPCCVCIACALLFATPRAGARYQTVGDRVLVDPGLRLDDALLTALEIPVRLAFITQEAHGAGWVATYPSVAGPTRAPLAPERCAALAQLPLVRALLPGTEALLVFGRQPVGPLEGFGVAVDRCYALVGMLRRKWRGFSGGNEVWSDVEAFFTELRARAQPLSANLQNPVNTLNTRGLARGPR
jgi:hypothetical protein